MFTGVNMMDSADEGEATDEYSNQEMETANDSFSDAAHAPSFVKSEPSYQQEDVKPTFNSANWALAIPGSGSNSQFSSPALSSSSSSLPRFPQFTQSIHRGQNMSSPSRRVRGVRRGPMSMMGLVRTKLQMIWLNLQFMNFVNKFNGKSKLSTKFLVDAGSVGLHFH